MPITSATVTDLGPAGVTVLAPSVDANHTLGPMETVISGLDIGSRVAIRRRDDVPGTWVVVGEFASLPTQGQPDTVARSSTMGIRWKVRKKIPDTFTARWAVALPSSHPVSDTFSVRWAIRRRISDTLELRWRVFTNINNIGTDIRAYARLAGDQIVVVPNGIYTAGWLTDAAHPATNGSLHGWIILVAETPGGVIINQAPPANWNDSFPRNSDGTFVTSYDLEIVGATSRVAFVGMTFTNGMVHVGSGFGSSAGNVGFYNCDFSFPASVWDAEPGHRAGGAVNTTGGTYHNFHYAPRAVRFSYGAHDVALVRCTVHDTGTGIFADGGAVTTNISAVGLEVYNLTDGGVGIDPLDRIHPDAMAWFGQKNNLVLTDFYLHPDNPGTAGIGMENTVYDTESTVTMARGWSTRAGNAGLQWGGYSGRYDGNGNFIRWGTDRVTATLTDIRVYDNGTGHGAERNDEGWNAVQYFHDAQAGYGLAGWAHPEALFANTTRCSTGQAPLAGTPDPFTAWKALPGHSPATADAVATLRSVLAF